MTRPRMVIIAGPPGAGKSSIFALSDFAENVFNADDRAAELNGGSYQSIPLSVRAAVQSRICAVRSLEHCRRYVVRTGNHAA